MHLRLTVLLWMVAGTLATSVALFGQDAAKPATKTYQVDTANSKIYVKVGSATRLGHPHGVEGRLKSGAVGRSHPSTYWKVGRWNWVTTSKGPAAGSRHSISTCWNCISSS